MNAINRSRPNKTGEEPSLDPSIRKALLEERPKIIIWTMYLFLILSCASFAGHAMPNPLHKVYIPYMNYQNHIDPRLNRGGPTPGYLWQGVLQVIPRLTIEVETEHNCTVTGSFPDERDCSRFYTCNEIGGKLVVIIYGCLPDKADLLLSYPRST